MVTTPTTIPPVLRSLARWSHWNYAEIDGRHTKVPVEVLGGKRGSSTDPATWTTYETARRALDQRIGTERQAEGLFYTLVRDDGFVAFDFDDCLDERGITDPRIARYVALLDSYTYVTPSSKGLRVIIKADWPDAKDGRTKHEWGVEVYAGSRFITMTERTWGMAQPIRERQAVLDAIYADLFPPKAVPVQKSQVGTSGPTTYSDDDVIALLSGFANGRKFDDLMAGNWQAHYPSGSEADGGLVGIISFVTQDESQILRIVQRSGMWDEKWERGDYQRSTLDYNRYRTEVYSPPPPRFSTPPRPQPSQKSQVVPSDGADVVTAEDYARLAAYATLIEEQRDVLLRENVDLRAHLTSVFEVLGNEKMPALDRIIMIAATNQTDSLISREHADEQGRVHTSRGAIAEAAGCNPKRVGEVLQQYAEIVPIDRKVTRERVIHKPVGGGLYADPFTGEVSDEKEHWVSELRVGLPEGSTKTLKTLAVVDPVAATNGKVKQHGGKRDPRPKVCPDHPAADVTINETITCRECDKVLRTTTKQVVAAPEWLKSQVVLSEPRPMQPTLAFVAAGGGGS